MERNEKYERFLREERIEELLTLTKNSKNPLDKFYHLRALRKIGEFNIALSFISEFQMELYSYDAPFLIELHIDTLTEIDDLNQALNVLKQYEYFPYFSLETNELISSLQEQVKKRRHERHEAKKYDLQALDSLFFQGNEQQAFAALNYIEKNYNEHYISLLQKVLLNSPHEMIKSFTLILLFEKKHAEQVKINKFNKIMPVVPSTLFAPANGKTQRVLLKKIVKLGKEDEDFNFQKLMTEIFFHHVGFIYPISYMSEDIDDLSHYFQYLALNTIGRTINFEDFFLEYGYRPFDLLDLDSKYHFMAFLVSTNK